MMHGLTTASHSTAYPGTPRSFSPCQIPNSALYRAPCTEQTGTGQVPNYPVVLVPDKYPTARFIGHCAHNRLALAKYPNTPQFQSLTNALQQALQGTVHNKYPSLLVSDKCSIARYTVVQSIVHITDGHWPLAKCVCICPVLLGRSQVSHSALQGTVLRTEWHQPSAPQCSIGHCAQKRKLHQPSTPQCSGHCAQKRKWHQPSAHLLISKV